MSIGALDSILETRRSQPQQLVEVLQDVQKTFGYIPKETMMSVSDELGVPLIEVVRVSHFYKAFSLKPRGKHVMTMCTGTACHVRGSNLLLEEAMNELDIDVGQTTSDKMFTVESVNCLGACALGPVVVVNDSYHDHMTAKKLKELITAIRASEKGEKN